MVAAKNSRKAARGLVAGLGDHARHDNAGMVSGRDSAGTSVFDRGSRENKRLQRAVMVTRVGGTSSGFSYSWAGRCRASELDEGCYAAA